MHGHTHLCTHCGWCHHKATLICMFMIILSFIQLSKTLIFSVSPSYTHSCSHAHTHTFTYTHTLSLCLSVCLSLSLSLSLCLSLSLSVIAVDMSTGVAHPCSSRPVVTLSADTTGTRPVGARPFSGCWGQVHFNVSQNNGTLKQFYQVTEPLPLIFVVLVETTSSLNINLKRLYSSYLPLTHARSRARTHTLSSISSAKFQEF